MRTQVLSLTLFIILLSAAMPVQGQQALTFREPTPGPTVSYVTAVLEEAYADLGITLNYQQLPRLRAEQLAENGEIAGELGRLSGLDKQLKNLNRVPFELYRFSIVLVAKRSECGLCTLKAVDNIAYVSGMRAAHTVLEEAAFSRPIFQQTEIQQIAKLLNAERIDAALVADFQLRNLKLANPEQFIVYHLQEEIGYHYLHDDYKHLIEPLYQRLSLMRASGRLAQLQKRYQLKLPEQLQPIPMPTRILATSAMQPELTEANGEGKLWQLIRNAYSDALDQVETSVSNWPRALNSLLERKAQLLVGVQKNQFGENLLYSKQPLAMDDALYLFTRDENTKKTLLAGRGSLTVCYSGAEEQRSLLPENISFYRANTSLDCFALLDLNRIEGVIDYKHNLPDWSTTPYRRERLRDPVPLHVAFNNDELGKMLKAHLDRALESQLSPSFISENSDTIR